MDNLEKVQEKLEKVEEKVEENTLAMEMLKELKRSGTRKFVIIVILIIALIVSNIGWLLYESQFETVETIEQYMEDLDEVQNSNFSQSIK